MSEEKNNKRITSGTLTAFAFILVLLLLLGSVCSKPRTFLYSFENSYVAQLNQESTAIDKAKAAISAFELTLADRIAFKTPFNELYGAFQTYACPTRRYISDYNYGYLYKTCYDQIAFSVPLASEAEVAGAANRVEALSEELSEAGIDFEFVTLPYKLPPESLRPGNQLPRGFYDYANENADALLSELKNRGVATFDARPAFWGSEHTQNELFFNTDHHWSIRGAFLGTGILAEHLRESYGFEITPELYTAKNFSVTTYEKDFIGSLGRRVGIAWGGVDDFELIEPKFENEIHLSQYDVSGDIDITGSFRNVVLEYDRYIAPKDRRTNRYAVYHGDYRELRFENKKAGNERKILIVKDSFGLPVYSFLSLGVGEVRALDLRLFMGDVAEYAKEYKPDLVLVMYNCDCLRERMFDFTVD